MDPDLSLYDPRELRRTSSVPKSARFPDGFPFREPLVTLIHIDGVGKITQAASGRGGDMTAKQNMAEAVEQGEVLLAAWPGTIWQDVFWVDDLEALRASLRRSV